MAQTRKLIHWMFDTLKKVHLPSAACAPVHSHFEYRACFREKHDG